MSVDPIDELGRTIGNALNRQNDLERSSVHPDDAVTVLLFPTEQDFNFVDLNVVGRTRTIEDSFILGHDDNAVLGTSKLGDRRGTATEVLRRRWVWDDQTEFNKGTNDNVKVDLGDLRLNM